MTNSEDTAKPKRIQRRRTKGWEMPESAVFVGSTTIWGTHVKVAEYGRELAIANYRRRMEGYRQIGALTALDSSLLRGKDLVCWCRLSEPCHADILLEIANS